MFCLLKSYLLIESQNLSSIVIFSSKMRSISKLFVDFIFICIYFLVFINCFNIDTKFPIVLDSPLNKNFENYFGLSVEMQTIGSQVM